MQKMNAVLENNILTVGTFVDFKEYLSKLMATVDILKPTNIRKLVVKDSKCSLDVTDLQHFLNEDYFDNLQDIEIVNPDERFCTLNGMLYSANQQLFYFCPHGREGTLVIPDGTTTITYLSSINGYAFARSYALKSVEGGKNIEQIAHYAFSACNHLKNFEFGKHIKNIGRRAFSNTALTTVDLPEGLFSVGRSAFNTTCLDNASDGFEPVDALHMYDIHIPSTLKLIEPLAFANAANVYTPFVNAALIHACMRTENLKRCYKCNTWRLKIKGKPDVIVPKSIETTAYMNIMANEINLALRLQSEHAQTPAAETAEVIPPELYQYSSDSTGLTAALEQCRKYPSANLRRFITRNTTPIFKNLVCNSLNKDGEEILVSLIKDNVFTDMALKKFLDKIEKSNHQEKMTTIKAYILDAIGHKARSLSI